MSVDGRSWIAERHPDKVATVAAFLDMVVAENIVQNLIAPSTIPHIWGRHALDSAQLLAFDRPDAQWIDIGTGGGFPGIVVAILRTGPVTLVEPRAKRAAFLQRCVDELDLTDVRVYNGKIEALEGVSAGIISARAVASMDALLTAARRCATNATRWLLPRGRSGEEELAALRQRWQGVFHVEHSVVDPTSAIIILDKVRTR